VELAAGRDPAEGARIADLITPDPEKEGSNEEQNTGAGIFYQA
jgi:hypothetical protein